MTRKSPYLGAPAKHEIRVHLDAVTHARLRAVAQAEGLPVGLVARRYLLRALASEHASSNGGAR